MSSQTGVQTLSDKRRIYEISGDRGNTYIVAKRTPCVQSVIERHYGNSRSNFSKFPQCCDINSVVTFIRRIINFGSDIWDSISTVYKLYTDSH